MISFVSYGMRYELDRPRLDRHKNLFFMCKSSFSDMVPVKYSRQRKAIAVCAPMIETPDDELDWIPLDDKTIAQIEDVYAELLNQHIDLFAYFVNKCMQGKMYVSFWFCFDLNDKPIYDLQPISEIDHTFGVAIDDVLLYVARNVAPQYTSNIIDWRTIVHAVMQHNNLEFPATEADVLAKYPTAVHIRCMQFHDSLLGDLFEPLNDTKFPPGTVEYFDVPYIDIVKQYLALQNVC